METDMRIYGSVEELIGKTPLVKLDRYGKASGALANIVAKIEGQNPGGSAKDRIAIEMIEAKELSGEILPGATIIEPTSGNTGIGLCMIAAARGYKAVIVMPSNMSKERITLMKAYGAEVVLTDAALGMSGAIAKAEELQKSTPNSFIPGQFDNPDNPAAHYKTTGPEIYEDTDGKVDIFVCGVGTGGTISGVAKYLREKNPDVKIIAVEPKDSAVLSGGKAGAHGLQGIGAGFVPKILDTSCYNEVITVTTEDAYETARLLGKKEGILAGISSGAALFAATLVAKREENRSKNIVVLLPDTGSRYLSSDLFES
jgi:cysteine synthase A